MEQQKQFDIIDKLIKEIPLKDEILNSTANGILTITLNRPKKFNSLTLPMYHEIGRLLKQANEDPKVKVVLLQGNGANFLCW